jgi:SagB-type dehydrogenase family enzyme
VSSAGSPSLSRGLALVPNAAGLLVEGGPRRVWLPGDTAAATLPKLLALLDGQHDAAAIRDELGLTNRQLDHVLGVLDGCGLLEPAGRRGGDDGSASAAGSAVAGEIATYLSRSLSGRGDSRSAGEALGVLRECAVLLTGDSPAFGLIAADLREMGVGVVTQTADPARLAAGVTGGMGSSGMLIVAYDDGESGGTLRRAVAAGQDAGVPVLRIAAGRDYADTGPLLQPGYTACLSCLRRGLAEAGWAAEAAEAIWAEGTGEPGTEGAVPPGPVCWLLAGLAVDEIVAVLAQIDAMASPRHLTRAGITGPDVARRLVTPYAGCADCAGPGGPRDLADGAARDLALAYEWQRSWRLGEAAGPDRLLAAEKERLHRLEAARPAFPAAPRMTLARPEPDAPRAADVAPMARGPLGSTATAAGSGLDAGMLAGLLMLTAGRRVGRDPAGHDWRWAPSGGNFGSPAAYVITRPGLADLPGNCLRYDDETHELLAGRSGTVALRDAVRGTDLASGDLDAVLVLVADVGRLAGKYGSFAFRLAHLDAGCAAMQLTAVAAGCGLEVSFATSWDGQMAELLELKPEAEMVTVVTGLRAVRRKESPCP